MNSELKQPWNDITALPITHLRKLPFRNPNTATTAPIKVAAVKINERIHARQLAQYLGLRFHLITVDIIHLERTLVKMMDSQAGLIFYYITWRLIFSNTKLQPPGCPNITDGMTWLRGWLTFRVMGKQSLFPWRYSRKWINHS